MRTLEFKKKCIHVNMRGSLGYQEFTEQFIFNGGMKMLLKCFALIGQRHTLLFLYFYSVSLCRLLDVHTWGCVCSCASAHTHTHTHRTIPQGFSSIGNLQELKKGTKSSVYEQLLKSKHILTHVFTQFILFRTAESIWKEKLIKKMQGVNYLLLEF